MTRFRKVCNDQIVERIVLIRFIRKMSRSIYYLTKRLNNRQFQNLDCVYISNIIMLKQVDIMSIIITKYKKMFADASRKREIEREWGRGKER